MPAVQEWPQRSRGRPNVVSAQGPARTGDFNPQHTCGLTLCEAATISRAEQVERSIRDRRHSDVQGPLRLVRGARRQHWRSQQSSPSHAVLGCQHHLSVSVWAKVVETLYSSIIRRPTSPDRPQVRALMVVTTSRTSGSWWCGNAHLFSFLVRCLHLLSGMVRYFLRAVHCPSCGASGAILTDMLGTYAMDVDTQFTYSLAHLPMTGSSSGGRRFGLCESRESHLKYFRG